ncbi:hypothetical protein GJ744_002285 [Endocarpon pusillum]|uniref:Uncharacterized protein n=1 Tax=Endocarpon pusillum TaxID=364733 RepID=A0A8H7AMZ1_9EURO|nr:hypothetical protein GJ744_002285 [Endocarpon pusillum]
MVNVKGAKDRGVLTSGWIVFVTQPIEPRRSSFHWLHTSNTIDECWFKCHWRRRWREAKYESPLATRNPLYVAVPVAAAVAVIAAAELAAALWTRFTHPRAGLAAVWPSNIKQSSGSPLPPVNVCYCRQKVQ